MPPVIALTGRRIDPPEAEVRRFPLENVELVGQRLRSLLQGRQADTLASSAACGADLVALAAAEELGLRRRVVLPFNPERFRQTSVTDRPGDWGPLYDRTIEAAALAGDLVVLENAGEGGAAYAAANERILDEALLLAGVAGAPEGKATAPVPVGTALAVIVWEGRSRGDHDATEHFAISARERGLTVEDVATR